MPMLQIAASVATQGTMPRETSLMTLAHDEEIKQLIPDIGASTDGSADWAYWDKAERLVCSLLKKKLFPDEVTPVENANDLRKLGVWFLKVTLQSEQGHTNTFTLINDHDKAPQ